MSRKRSKFPVQKLKPFVDFSDKDFLMILIKIKNNDESSWDLHQS